MWFPNFGIWWSWEWSWEGFGFRGRPPTLLRRVLLGRKLLSRWWRRMTTWSSNFSCVASGKPQKALAGVVTKMEIFIVNKYHLWFTSLVSICLSFCLSIYVSIYLPIHLSTHIYPMYHVSSLPPNTFHDRKRLGKFLPHVHVRTPKLWTFPMLRIKLPLQKDLSAQDFEVEKWLEVIKS